MALSRTSLPSLPRSATLPRSGTATRPRSASRRHWTLRVGAVVLIAVVAVLVLTPWIAPYDPARQDLAQRLAGPGARHWLGTDQLGRDVLSRLMWGGRFSVSIAAITLIISAGAGTVIGALSARLGGAVDEAIMRTVDLLISIPDVVVALFLIAGLGTGYGTLIAALTLVGWTPFARLMRGLTLEINSREYIEAAESLGCSRTFIIFRHVIPNALRPMTALGFLRFGHKLITVGALSFLGLGVQPPASDWGAMLVDAQPYTERDSLLVFAPGLAIFITALSVTLIGHGTDLRQKKAADAG